MSSQPTVTQAVDWLMKQLTLEYNRTCLRHWRKLYGNAYADKVKAAYMERIKK